MLQAASCPRASAAETVSSLRWSRASSAKWSVRVLGLLAQENSRPSEILRACPGLSAKVMNERLRKLVRFGIAHRTVFGDKPPVEVEYGLTLRPSLPRDPRRSASRCRRPWMPATEWWQRGPVAGVPAVLQPVAHILLQVRESVGELVGPLAVDDWNARPAGVAPVAFHATHRRCH